MTITIYDADNMMTFMTVVVTAVVVAMRGGVREGGGEGVTVTVTWVLCQLSLKRQRRVFFTPSFAAHLPTRLNNFLGSSPNMVSRFASLQVNVVSAFHRLHEVTIPLLSTSCRHFCFAHDLHRDPRCPIHILIIMPRGF